MDKHVPIKNRFNALDDPVWRYVFEQISTSSVTQCFNDIFIVIESGQHQYRNLRKSLLNLLRSFNATAAGHADIHQSYIGL
ncbi:hypothetical protein D3C75_1105410 [compost metagenome]